MPQHDDVAPSSPATSEATVLNLGLGRFETATVQRIRVLGRGRASVAVLADVVTETGSRRVAEKHFTAAGLTRAIYKAAFWAPFPYGVNEDAALCCLYRRRVAGALFQAEAGWRLAEALYVRRCQAGHLVLGTEWIDGRPVAPPRPDSGPEGGGTPGEMRTLLHQMRRMERCLLDWGLTGSGWQVSASAIVATANLLRANDGEFVCVDLESGIPALLVPRYAWLAITKRAFPLFDDVDERRLRRYLGDNRAHLRAALGERGHAELELSVERLFEHSGNWKRTEPAPGRHGAALLFDARLRATIRNTLAERWHQQSRLDDVAAARLRDSRRLVLQPLVILGAIPTPLGTLLQRIAGNRTFRIRFRDAVLDPQILDAELRAYQARRAADLAHDGRITSQRAARLARGLRSAISFALHAFLAKLLPAKAHRYLTDWRELKTAIKFAFLTLISEELQERLARSFVDAATRRWIALGRLDETGRQHLLQELDRGEAPEYVRGFGMHLALKFFAPVTGSLKAIGLMLLVTPWRPVGFLLLFNPSLFRIMITTYRWLRRRDRRASYAVAFVISPVPSLGTLAFPFQFYRRSPWLCRFLIRSTLSRVAGAIPIYGGVATRLEHAMVRLATPIASLVGALVWPLAWLDRDRSWGEHRLPDREPARTRGRLAPHIAQAVAWLSRPAERRDPCTRPTLASRKALDPGAR